ncbi:tetratricopeptide repeat protein [Azospirillum sp. sgz301742]
MDFGLLSFPVMIASMLFGYAVFFDTSAVVFHDVSVPNAVVSDGYSARVVASRLANEVRVIDQKARTVKELREFVLPDDESAVNALGDYFKFGEPIRAVQELIGLVDYNFTGDMVRQGGDLKLSVRGSAHKKKKVFNEVVTGKDPEQIVHEMAINIVRFIDPYIVASYVYETTKDQNSKDFSAAMHEVRYCLIHLPKEDLHWAYNLYGLILVQQGKPDAAIERFNEALQLKPDFVLAVYNTGNALLEKKQYDQAIGKFNEVLKLDAKNKIRTPHAYTQWGVALTRQGQADAAVSKFQKAIQVDPMYADAYYRLGMVLKQQGKVKEAQEMIQKAVDRAPLRKDYAADLDPQLIN